MTQRRRTSSPHGKKKHSFQGINRAGQIIGPFTVLADEGKRTKRGEVLWPVRDTRDGSVKYRRTYAVIRMARDYSSLAPTSPLLSVTRVVQ